MEWLSNFDPQTLVDAWQDLSDGDQMVARVLIAVVAINLGIVPLVRAIRGRDK